MNEALEINDLVYSYDGKENAIDGISFNVEKGSYISIIGHNGSGKSTLAKLIIGLLEKKNGTIKVFGEELNEKNLSSIRHHVGIIFQNPDNQFIGATVEDDIAFGLENNCVPHKDMKKIIDDYAEKVGMKEYLTKEPSNLSGGQKQRVAIAGVLAMKPDIIIMDEATAMLDPKGRREIRELTLKMRHENPNMTFISITHDIDEAYQADKVLVLNKGKILLWDTPEEVFKHQEELESAKLEVPFIYQVNKKLQSNHVLDHDILDEKELVKYLCR